MTTKGFMLKVGKALLGLAFLTASNAFGFSLLGPYTPWQVQGLAYQWPGADIGGPMNANVGEGFRWNIPVITYAYDRSFLNYFGPEGVRAVDEAIHLLNDLPAASNISPDLSEYSTHTLRENFEAETLGIVDLKSTALHFLVEELGFADAVRFTFTLRGREVVTVGGVQQTNYLTVFRNYDPQTLDVTPYVNGVLYSYDILEFGAPFQHADAVESPRFAGIESVPVSTGFARAGDTGPSAAFFPGLFRTGLTRDDVGAYRYLYHKNNFAVESLLTNTVLGTRLDASWRPFVNITNFAGVTNQFIGTNGLIGGFGTNAPVFVGLRGGRNKLRFQKVVFDGVLGSTFTPITNAYTDVVVSSNALVVQPVLRPVTQPDIVFSAGDLGLAQGISPVVITRTGTDGWIDNDALNGSDEVGQFSRGPGVIQPQVVITFTDQLPAFFNTGGAFLDGFEEDSSFIIGAWGSFDGSTNPPVVFSESGLLNINQLRAQILGAGGQ